MFKPYPPTFTGSTASIGGRAGLVPVPPAGSQNGYLQGDGTWGTGLPLDVKLSVRATSLSNITLSGTQTVDGVALVAGNRVLVAGQTSAPTNGIYVVASGAWARSNDANTSAGVTSGMFTFVSEGTVGAGNGYVLTTPDPIVLGTTALTFTQFSGAGEITAGNNITKTGNVLATTTALTLLNSVTSTAGTALTLATGTSGTFLTGASAGAVTVAAQGTNQSVTLTPSGTGIVQTASVIQAPNFYTSAAVSIGMKGTILVGGDVGVQNPSGQVSISAGTNFSIADTNGQNARFVNTHLLLGGLTTDGTGVLQLPTGTGIANGITFNASSNTGLASFGSNQMALYGGGNTLVWTGSGTQTLQVGSWVGSSNSIITGTNAGAGNSNRVGDSLSIQGGSSTGTGAGGSLFFQTAPAGTTGTSLNAYVTALTLDSSQNATFASSIILTNTSGARAIQTAANNLIFQTNGANTALTLDTSQNTLVAKKITNYNGIATAGWGVGAIQGATEVTAQSAANASIATYTNGAADGTYRVSAQVDVTAATALSTTITCTYTDKGNTQRVMIFPVQQLTGSFIAGGLITGTGAWETPVMHIRCKASTSITIGTTAGTFTGVTYSADAVIEQVA